VAKVHRNGTVARQRDPLTRGLQILAAMVDSEEGSCGVRELAARSGLPASSVHRLLGVLQEIGMVHQNEEDRYEIGLEFYRMAWRCSDHRSLKTIAQPVLAGLMERTGESALLGILDEDRLEMLFAICVESPHPVRYIVELNKWIPIHAGASGLAILAYLTPDQRAAVVRSTNLAPLTKRTITDPEQLEAELARIRERGYAVSQGQRIDGACAVCAPIRNRFGRVVGDVCISLPEQRFDPEAVPHLGELVMEAAAEITRKIGG